MTTCKDCLHYDICTFHITGNENERCCHFKNKADVVEVVRCKDCKYSFDNDSVLCWCDFWCNYTALSDFCMHGERKEEREEK